jgi:hypothetical protein
VGVTADYDLIEKETGGVVGGREGRMTVRRSELDPPALAEAALRALKHSAGSYQPSARE